MNINNRNGNIEIWSFGRGWYQLFTDDVKILERVIRWNKVKKFGIYYYPDGSIGISILFPSSIYDRVARELGLPKKVKSSGRVKQGQRLQNSYNIGQVKSSNLPAVEV